MVSSLNALSDKFITGGKYFHLRDLIEKSPIPDGIAREIVDILLAEDLSNSTNYQEIFDSLATNTRSYLKSNSNLKNFIEFYPALFVKENGMLRLKPLEEQTLSKPDYDLDNLGSDLEIVKDLITLMSKSNSNVQSEDRIITVLDNYDQLVYHTRWLCQKTGENLSNSSMRKTITKHPNIFEIHGSFVNLVTCAEHRLCEKTVSLNILSIIKSQPNISSAEIVSRLAPILSLIHI